MKNEKRINKIIYISLISGCSVLLLSLFFVYLFTSVSEVLANIIALLSTVLGAFASVVEFKKNEAVNLSNDILSIYMAFLDVPTNKEIQYKLECLKRRNVNLFEEKDIEGIRNYLSYFNSVAFLILANEIKIKKINTVLGYRFFLIMNCPYVQDLEIIPNAQAYRPCIKLHKKWGDWAKANNFKRSGDATSLEKRFVDYDKFAN